MMMFLPDVNLWLALAFESHVHHTAAREWLDLQQDAIWFCRLTQQGFLRIATNPKAFAEEAVTPAEAWRLYDRFQADGRINYLSEPVNLEPPWRDYSSRESFSAKLWSDAYLAAFAIAAGYKVVTFDRDFLRFDAEYAIVLGR